jgi:hypothetical protein
MSPPPPLLLGKYGAELELGGGATYSRAGAAALLSGCETALCSVRVGEGDEATVPLGKAGRLKGMVSTLTIW